MHIIQLSINQDQHDNTNKKNNLIIIMKITATIININSYSSNLAAATEQKSRLQLQLLQSELLSEIAFIFQHYF